MLPAGAINMSKRYAIKFHPPGDPKNIKEIGAEFNLRGTS